MAGPGLLAILFPVFIAVGVGAALATAFISFEQKPNQLQYYGYGSKDDKRRRSTPSSSNTTPKQKTVTNPCNICGMNIPDINTKTKLACDHEFHETCIVHYFRRNSNGEKIAKCPDLDCRKSFSLPI